MRKPLIAIVGSPDPKRVDGLPAPDSAGAQEAAHQLGVALVRAGYRIAVYSSEARFIERHLVEGYLKCNQAAKGSIEVHYPKGREDYQEFPLYQGCRQCFDPIPSDDPVWEVSFYRSLRRADGLILIGGGESTRVAGLTAIADGRPLVSIAAFGGSAAKIQRFLAGQPNEPAAHHIATPEQRSLMGEAWTASSAEALIRCLDEQVAIYTDLKEKMQLEQEITKDKENGLRIVWLSDLHMTCEPDKPPRFLSRLKRQFWTLFHIKHNRLTQHFPKMNLETILAEVQQIKPHHILVTGDLTNCAEDTEFSTIRELFKDTQRTIQGGQLRDLDPELWTILPGNHDVTEENRASGSERRNLGSFFKHFETVFESAGPDYDGAFPFRKSLPLRSPDGVHVLLLGLDSTERRPVWQIGYNASGRIDQDQLERLGKRLADTKDRDVVLVALHHHPMIVPQIMSETEERFMSLKETDGRRLIKLCAHTRVGAILHGHCHEFSFWSLSRRDTHQMAVIGSPCGTRDMPKTNVTFLELREAWQEPRRTGLAVYRRTYTDRGWEKKYITFIDEPPTNRNRAPGLATV